jgi:REP element-mobilizing transposase RayT
MACGNGRRDIVRDDDDRRKWMELLERTVGAHGWELFSFVLMSNHFHLFFRTPEPNLSRGMQRLISGHASHLARRIRRSGHVFQGRFRAQLVEDETYFWPVSRYLHLNPVRARLVDHPRDWPWSSYAGHDSRRRRLDWIAYDTLLSAVPSEFGGMDPASAYRRYVTSSLSEPVASPLGSAWRGLVVGSEPFVRQVKARLAASPSTAHGIPPKQLSLLDRQQVYEAVLEHYGRPPEALSQRGARDRCRGVAAYLARRLTGTTLRELANDLGLSRPDSVPNLTRRIDRDLRDIRALAKDIRAIEKALLEEHTRNKA